jgi:20S proteasome alpha/beta subunit
MTPEEIKQVTCQCKDKNKVNNVYRDEDTNHWLHDDCDMPVEAIAKFTCSTCEEPAINNIFYEFNLYKDYDSNGKLTTLLECKDCA